MEQETLHILGPWSWDDLQTRVKLAFEIPPVSFKRIAMGTLPRHCSYFDVLQMS